MSIPILGIDPGLTGSAVLLDERVTFFDTPTLNVGRGKQTKRQHSVTEMAMWLRTVRLNFPSVLAVLEATHSMPGQGVRSMFSMGEGFGIWKGLLAGMGIPFELVTPQRWKAAMMNGQGREKDAARFKAMQLYPSVAEQLSRKKDIGRADALLIAAYGQRVFGGKQEVA